MAGERSCGGEWKTARWLACGGRGQGQPRRPRGLFQKHSEPRVGGEAAGVLRACFSVRQVMDCARFAGIMLASRVPGVGGETDELTVRMAQVPAPSLSSFWIQARRC